MATDTTRDVRRLDRTGIDDDGLTVMPSGSLRDDHPERVEIVGSATPSQRGRDQSGVATWLPPVLVGVAVVALWQTLATAGVVASYLLPEPAEVFQAFWRGIESGLFWRYGRTTLVESLTGFTLGMLVALPLGYGIARSRWLARAIEPYLAASQAMPAIVLAPLLVLWLGYGLKAIAILAALIVFFPMVVNTALGVRTLDREVLDAARVDGAGFWPMLLHFEIPLALPVILAGMRTALTLSITGAVVGEFVIGDRGLGGLLTIARGNFDTPLVFATILLLMLMAAMMYWIVWLVEKGLGNKD